MEIVKPETDQANNLETCCATCPHFSPVNSPVKDFRTREPIGECRHSPPVSMLIPVTNLQGHGLSLQSVFPVIVETGWCGKHPQRTAL